MKVGEGVESELEGNYLITMATVFQIIYCYAPRTIK